MTIARQFDFVAGTKIKSADVDAELNNLITGVNNVDTDLQAYKATVYTKANLDAGQLDNRYYTGLVTDSKINAATSTKVVQTGTAFPDPPYADGQEFYRKDEKKLYIYDVSSTQWIPANKDLTPATTTVLGGVKIGTGVNVIADGTIDINDTLVRLRMGVYS